MKPPKRIVVLSSVEYGLAFNGMLHFRNKLTMQLKAQEGVTEELKANNQLEWVQRMNSIRNRAAEVVFKELIYV